MWMLVILKFKMTGRLTSSMMEKSMQSRGWGIWTQRKVSQTYIRPGNTW